MNIRLLHTKEEWESAASGLPLTFLQSWEWGSMQEAMGHPVYRLAFDDGVMTAIILSLGFGRNVLFAPQGPQLRAHVDAATFLESDVIKKIARDHSVIALRVEPIGGGIIHMKQVHDVSPRFTRVLDLTQSEEQLLAGMKTKTRYNIRLATKKNVEVRFATEYSDDLLTDWWTLVEETSERHGIAHHAKTYYKTMLRELMSAGVMEVGQAHHAGDLLGMTLNVRYRHTTTYVHGANTHNKKNLMATYALQWAAIQRAKEQGSTCYDFYGIAPEDQKNHPLAGVTRFKTGFGGETITSAGTFESGLSPVYALYSLYRRLRS